MNQEHACLAWTKRGTGTASHLHSDGESLWSYGWYEIARHVGDQVVYVRHDSDGYSSTTKGQISHVVGAARTAGLIVLRARGSRSAENTGYRGNGALGQPDWDWLKWTNWFAENWRSWSKRFYVLVNPSLMFRGDGVLTQARNSQCPVHLESLIESEPDRGVLCFKYERSISHITLEGDVHITKRMWGAHGYVWRYIQLNKLLKADPPTPLSQVVALPFRKTITVPVWQHVLFPGVEPVDLRQTLELDDRAFKHGTSGFAKRDGSVA